MRHHPRIDVSKFDTQEKDEACSVIGTFRQGCAIYLNQIFDELEDHEKRIRFLERAVFILLGAYAIIRTFFGH